MWSVNGEKTQNVSENNLLEKQYFTYVTLKEKRGEDIVQSSADMLLWSSARAAARSRLRDQAKNPAFVRSTASPLLLKGEL